MPDRHAQPDAHKDTPRIPAEHQRRQHELTQELAALGFCLPGSVTEREIRCPNPGCHCHADPPKPHGPYTAWTRKVNQKTVTHNLSPQQAQRYGPWLANNRRLRQLTSELQALSLQIVADAEGWGEK